MLTQEQQNQIDEVLNSVPVALPPEEFALLLRNAAQSLKDTEDAQPTGEEKVEDGKVVHRVLSLVMQVFQILTEKIEQERPLTVEEQQLLAELQWTIGKIAHRVARIIRGLREFESLETQKLLM